jgi:hypothetical protein
MIKHPGKTWWTFEAARNDSHMNQFSRLASLCWLANTDFSPCTGIEAVINYAAKYCSKSESQTSTYAEILPHVSDRNPMLSFVSKMMNRLIGERDYSAQEVCHLLLGLPLQEDSRVVGSVDCRLPEKHNHPLEFSVNNEVVEQKRTAYENTSSDLKTWKAFPILNSWSNGTSLRITPVPGGSGSSKAQGAVLLCSISQSRPTDSSRTFVGLSSCLTIPTVHMTNC